MKWLRRLLGVEELECKVKLLTERNASLESQVIASQQTQALVRSSVAGAELTADLEQYCRNHKIELTPQTAPAAVAALEVAQVVERYGFERVVLEEQPCPSAVVSIKELREHPEKYLPRLKQGMFGFPVELNFGRINSLMKEMFGNIGFEAMNYGISTTGIFRFVPKSLLGGYGVPRQEDASLLLHQAMRVSDLQQGINDDCWVYMDSLDFLHNASGLEAFFAERIELPAEARKKAIAGIHLAKMVYSTAMEIVAEERIRDTADLLQEEAISAMEVQDLTALTPEEQMREKVRSSLLQDLPGTRYEDVQKLLPIRSRGRFRILASERTLEILADDQERKGLTAQIGKELRDYTIWESVVMACYFARNIITNYQSLEDAVKAVLTGNPDAKVSGKCTDYTGLALHYLCEYLIPLFPEKFEGWAFGYDSEHIGDYKHCYMKAIHLRPDLKIDIFFVDPTSLASKGIDGMKTPKKVLEYMDTQNHPIEIIRSAEDLLAKPK